MPKKRPQARNRHAAVGIGQKLHVWGGDGDHNIPTSTFYSFDLPSKMWEESRELKCSLPDALCGMAVATDDKSAYFFGGVTGATYFDTLYQIDPSTLSCKKLSPAAQAGAPKKKCGSGMIYFDHKLVVHGGFEGQDCTDELHVFDLTTKTWSTQDTTGDKPPSMFYHTFTMIDKSRAVVFGGATGHSGNHRLNDTYVLDLNTWNWTKLDIPGTKPSCRLYHATCCIAGALLMVTGGHDEHYHNLGDVWILDVDNRTWSELILPEKISPCLAHSAVVFEEGPATRVVVLFGGKGDFYLSDTTLLHLEMKGGLWQVMSVVKVHDLERRDSKPRKKMKELAPTPQEIPDNLHVGTKERIEEEEIGSEKRKNDRAEKKEHKKEIQTQKTATDGAATSASFKAPSLPMHSGEGKAEVKEIDKSAATTTQSNSISMDEEGAGAKKTDSTVSSTSAHTESTPTVLTIPLSDLNIGSKMLGRGKFGRVREGHWKGMTVAVKTTQIYGSETLPQEIKVWNSLPPHRNIISLFGFSSEKLLTHTVMELAANGSLCDYLHIRMKKPSVDQSLVWASHVAHGMKHLHDHDVIHRDLKSPNVLLTDAWVAKLCDFGTARELTHTVTTDQAGTHRWMSPEIMATAKARINKKCDLFSYGMILFELFAHQLPYSGMENDVDVVKSVTAGIRPPIPSTLPLYLHSLLIRCWNEDPYKRPTFNEFVELMVLPKVL